ncbi:hypothetical protein L5M43_06195 [Shewanella sp. SW36]|uniref:hypothetical protein n=1 Tax=unclassified Shewanella TaxID=196818 RepID=UPI0021DAA717|nr:MULTISPECIES: hypothetical protein [unclassified Shewanella]MCU7974869.1 hypothetical protein [Shewanella sp. SW36]MCU7990258.1 hypothetical protein [Shewanella sp. SW1]MCU8052716.1 hypothetical protein [Shewanella sp. SM43]
MAIQNKTVSQRQKYAVLIAYQCPNLKCWHQIGESVELLPIEAQFLILSGHLSPVNTELAVVSDKAKKGAN